MPRALSALALRAIVLCTISTTTTGSRVVLVDGFLTGKLIELPDQADADDAHLLIWTMGYDVPTDALLHLKNNTHTTSQMLARAAEEKKRRAEEATFSSQVLTRGTKRKQQFYKCTSTHTQPTSPAEHVSYRRLCGWRRSEDGS